MAYVDEKCTKGKGRRLYTKEEMDSFIQSIKGLQSGMIKKETSADYKDISTFAVVNISGQERLMRCPSTGFKCWWSGHYAL